MSLIHAEQLTVDDLDNDKWLLIQIDTEIESIREMLGLDDNCRFYYISKVDSESGDITILYGSYGTDLGDSVFKVYDSSQEYYHDQDVLVTCRQRSLPIPNSKYQQLKPEYDSIAEQIAKEHERDCIACKIIKGESKRKKGLTQFVVSKLFDLKMFGYSSSSENYESKSFDRNTGVIYHYNTIESLWTRQGKQIQNNQCWSTGFAKCCGHNEDLLLPLTTIKDMIIGFGDYNISKLEVIDVGSDRSRRPTVVFSYVNKFYLYDQDENNEFIAELKYPVRTIQEAYDSMKPDIVKNAEKNNIEVKRQGEYFFIPTSLTDNDVIYQTSAMFETVPKYIETDRNGTIISNIEIPEFDDKIFFSLTDEQQKQFIDIIKTEGIVTKRKYIPSITKDSNHVVQCKGMHSYIDGLFNQTVVKGYVRHINRDHDKLMLGEQWHIVAKNEVVSAFSIDRHHMTRGD